MAETDLLPGEGKLWYYDAHRRCHLFHIRPHEPGVRGV